ncbi:hypothetical protein [Chachezhania sediminis]|uniref:hypothetical protein n=1 Tax=Chachezhania sediminis TaxID=2599291 RepID=UPI00131D3656|nr:hypothetical protein [Chachezhania sediminis]
MIDPHCHTSSIKVNRPAESVFALMSDGVKQGHWAWGSAGREDLGNGIFAGTSVFNGARTLVRLNVDPEMMVVNYDVGGSEETMRFRNMSRVLPGPVLGYGPDECVVSLLTWRLADQDDAAWAQISTVHEAEMYLIKGLAERDLP